MRKSTDKEKLTTGRKAKRRKVTKNREEDKKKLSLYGIYIFFCWFKFKGISVKSRGNWITLSFLLQFSSPNKGNW